MLIRKLNSKDDVYLSKTLLLLGLLHLLVKHHLAITLIESLVNTRVSPFKYFKDVIRSNPLRFKVGGIIPGTESHLTFLPSLWLPERKTLDSKTNENVKNTR